MAIVVRKNKIRCPKHPTYKAIRKPRSKCAQCNLIYNEKVKDKRKI